MHPGFVFLASPNQCEALSVGNRGSKEAESKVPKYGGGLAAAALVEQGVKWVFTLTGRTMFVAVLPLFMVSSLQAGTSLRSWLAAIR